MTDKIDLNVLHTGVPGLDILLGGGLPELSFNIIAGEPGCGKTTLAQQIMFALASSGQRALFFTAMGEPPVKMLRYQQQFSFFDFDKVDDAVKFVNLGSEVQQGNYETVLEQIVQQVQMHTPAFVFIDSFRSVIQGAKTDHPKIPALQDFVQQLAMHMTSWQATTFLIGEYSVAEKENNPIFTIADGILWLSQKVHHNAMTRKMQVIKIRGQEQLLGLHTFRIRGTGIEVFPRLIAAASSLGNPALPPPTAKRLGMGVPELDNMLNGGLPAGYSMLLVGPSGSGKTLLSTAFLAEGAAQGETSVIALFEKSPKPVPNDTLDALIRTGKVGLVNMRTLDLSIDETLHELLLTIDRMQATRVVLDSLSGFELALAPEFREDFRESLYRMVSVLTDRGMTVLLTTELEDRFTDLRFSPYGSAFLTDAIVMQRYVELAGQMKTVITVVKLRGSAHSRDFRQFDVVDGNIRISAAPFPGVGVLSGSCTKKME